MSRKVFGVDLDTVVAQQKVDIPKIVTHSLEYLNDRKAHLEEGLFRIPGNSIKIAQLKKQFDSDGSVDLFKQKELDTHTAACLLKLYLRELPTPVIIPRYYSTYLKVYQNPDQRQRLINFRKLVMGLPKSHRDLLVVILGYLRLVAQNQPVNKMSALNLALIFAPNLMRAEKETLTSIMEDADKVAGTLQLLIQEVDYLETGTPPAWFDSAGAVSLRSKAMSSPPVPRAPLKREETSVYDDLQPEKQSDSQNISNSTSTLTSSAETQPPSIEITPALSDQPSSNQTTQSTPSEPTGLEGQPSNALKSSTQSDPGTEPQNTTTIIPPTEKSPSVKRRKSKRDLSLSHEVVFGAANHDHVPKKGSRSFLDTSILRSCSDTSLATLDNINAADEKIIRQSVRNMRLLRGSYDVTNGYKGRRRLSMIGESIAKSQLFYSYQNLKSYATEDSKDTPENT